MMRLRITCICILIFSVFASVLAAADLYWERPVTLVDGGSRFPAASYGKNTSIVVWQDIEKTSDQQGKIWLSAQIMSSETGKNWVTKRRFAGPYAYSGEVPNLFSVAVNSAGVISVCALANAQTIAVFTSDNGGTSFTETKLNQGGISVVAPRVFRSYDGGFVLFATQGNSQSFSFKVYAFVRRKTLAGFPRFSAFAKVDQFLCARFYRFTERSRNGCFSVHLHREQPYHLSALFIVFGR